MTTQSGIPASVRPGEVFQAVRIDAVVEDSAVSLVLRGRAVAGGAPMHLRVFRQTHFDPCDPEPFEAFQRAADAMRALGAHCPLRVGLLPEGIAVFALSEAPPAHTLAARVAGAVAWEFARRWVIKLLGALETLHDKGFVHGALALECVGFRGEQVVLIDPWVLRWWSRVRERYHVRHWSVSIPEVPAAWQRFTAPERLYGQEPDARGDLYSVALLAYLVLTGSPYWNAPPSATLLDFAVELAVPEALAAATRAAERGHAHLLPAGFDAWFHKATHKRPDGRFSSAAEMRRALP